MTALYKFEVAYYYDDLDTIKQIIEHEDDVYDLFVYSCKYEYIDMIKLIYNSGKVAHIRQWEFINSCIHYKLEVLKCLHELYPIHDDWQSLLFNIACNNNQVEIAQWIFELPNFDYENFNHIMDQVKANKCKKIINWILKTYPLIEI